MLLAEKKRILIAPASFKGTLSALRVAEMVLAFLRDHFNAGQVVYTVCPIADGGDDTLAVLNAVDDGFQTHWLAVTGPVQGMQAQAAYLYHPGQKLAVIEAAQAHGLKLLPLNQPAPTQATSYGVGELICQVAERHAPESLIVSLGGSASTDAGMGALQALGVQFRDQSGRVMDEPVSGGQLSALAEVVWPPSWPLAGKLSIATDVTNPLLGVKGSAAVFGPQKGASVQQCKRLEAGLRHVSQLMMDSTGKDFTSISGAGAAGGLAYGLSHLPSAGIISGSQWMAETLMLPEKIANADIIITGEGRLDKTSFSGKATGRLLAMAGGKSVLVLCGQAEEGLSLPENVNVYPLVSAEDSPQWALENPDEALRQRLAELLPNLRSQWL